MGLPTLEILISTNDAGALGRIASAMPPKEEGVSYLSGWQKSEGHKVPQALAGRDDVRILRNPGTGLSQNRNFALDHASGDILLLADDDLIYTEGAFSRIREIFAASPGLDIATFRYECSDGSIEKIYPLSQVRLGRNLPKGYYVTSFEIAVRRLGRSGHLRFNPDFGLGATVLGCGEEEIYLHSALRLDHEVEFFPLTICVHDGPTTGSSPKLKDSSLRGNGATIALLYPVSWLLRLPLKAWRLWRSRRGSFFRNLWQLTYGALYAIFKIESPFNVESPREERKP